ncbi:hypothetical protein [Micromonospora sp. NPDC049497]|uniref:hypothetical protein n=1 Tax=Micromonospora sp. NPDC049497 TaxID=3364273 RepID=UPI0037889AD4
MRRGEQPPWIVPDGLWQHIEPLLPNLSATCGTGTKADTVIVRRDPPAGEAPRRARLVTTGD